MAPTRLGNVGSLLYVVLRLSMTTRLLLCSGDTLLLCASGPPHHGAYPGHHHPQQQHLFAGFAPPPSLFQHPHMQVNGVKMWILAGSTKFVLCGCCRYFGSSAATTYPLRSVYVVTAFLPLSRPHELAGAHLNKKVFLEFFCFVLSETIIISSKFTSKVRWTCRIFILF